MRLNQNEMKREHCFVSGHGLDVSDIELLHTENKFFKQLALEELEIMWYKLQLREGLLNNESMM